MADGSSRPQVTGRKMRRWIGFSLMHLIPMTVRRSFSNASGKSQSTFSFFCLWLAVGCFRRPWTVCAFFLSFKETKPIKVLFPTNQYHCQWNISWHHKKKENGTQAAHFNWVSHLHAFGTRCFARKKWILHTWFKISIASPTTGFLLFLFKPRSIDCPKTQSKKIFVKQTTKAECILKCVLVFITCSHSRTNGQTPAADIELLHSKQ